MVGVVSNGKGSARDGMAARMAALMVETLEAGVANPQGWQAPWRSAGWSGGASNAVTGARYRGGNAAWLSLLEFTHPGIAGPWATYRQWASVGAQVRKGEKSTGIVAPLPVEWADKDDPDQIHKGITFRGVSVFHCGQVDGWERPGEDDADMVPEGVRSETFDVWLDGFRRVADVREDREPRAYFSPAGDFIHLPESGMFRTWQGYAGTVTHECAHWSGHADRLGRFDGKAPSREDYAAEELVAELTAATLGAEFGFTADGELAHDHRDYLANWLSALKNDPAYLWRAATLADRAARYLLDGVQES